MRATTNKQRSPTERKMAAAVGKYNSRLQGERKNPNVYHVMNITCIDIRAIGTNIYMYMRGEIYKQPSVVIHKCKRILYI
jgi:hypothetical protein